MDDADHEAVAKHKWYAADNGCGNWYAANNQLGYMHRFILKPEARSPVDHANGDGLDNRRENIRVCTVSQNGMNKIAKRSAPTPYKGVIRHKQRGKPWQARIVVDRKQVHLGLFDDPRDAAMAYDLAAREHFGEFARTNFSEDGHAVQV